MIHWGKVRCGVVWLSGHDRPKDSPIRRRWRVYVGRRMVLSLPMTTVEWSR